MRISFTPQRRDDTLTVTREGEVLTINGEVYDFSALPNGGLLPVEAINSDWIVSDVVRTDDGLALTLLLPHGPGPSAAVALPHVLVNPANGVLAIPFDQPPIVPDVEQEASDE